MKIKEIIAEIKIGQSNPAYAPSPGTAPKAPSVPSAPTAATAPKAPATAPKTPPQPAQGSGSTTLGNKTSGASTLGSQSPGSATIPASPTPASTVQTPQNTVPPIGAATTSQDDDEQDISSGPKGIMGGIKAGLGMNPNQSFGQGLATKTLQATGMNATAAELNPGETNAPIGGTLDATARGQYKVGGILKHPMMGDLNIRKVNQYGVTVYSPRLGHDVRFGPQALRTIQGTRGSGGQTS